MTALSAENNYVGVSCGKLGQSCEVYSKKNHLLYLDTKDDSYELIPAHPDMKPYKIAIFFSGVERTLAGSKYNMRVDECKSAVSSIYKYETGSVELKTLYEITRKTDGIYEGRFSCAGFKGCCMALFDPTYEEEVVAKVSVEKPAEQESHWCCPTFYYYTREDATFIHKGIEAGCGTDAPGSYIAWLSTQVPVYAMEMPGRRYDIGNLESYQNVQEEYCGIDTI